jgi:ribose transport system ATP-binding protein
MGNAVVKSAPVLEMKGISKSYPGVRALNGVGFDVRAGEVHALVGENGAGKSTLMKILAGAIPMDSGTILMDGKVVHIDSPLAAISHGIGIIYQEFNLVPYMSAAENIFLGREPRGVAPGFIDFAKMNNEAQQVLDRLGVKISAKMLVSRMSVAQRQMVEIAKTISKKARVIAMDEPSATLTEHELDNLFALIAQLKSEGVGVIYISHRLEEIFQIADRVTVLRDGQLVATKDIADTNRDDIIQMMVGREIKEKIPKRAAELGEKLLEVRGLCREGVLKDVSFELRRGEILGFAGLVGAGRTEVARCIFGADPIDAGEIILDGEKVTISSPLDAIKLGIGFVTEDRKLLGLILSMAVRENISLANLDMLALLGFIDLKKERRVAEGYVSDLSIKTPSVEQKVENLSGGTQQKVVLAKWLFTKSKVLIFDEPTRGIDVGSKVEIYQLMNKLAAQGVGIIMISSELPEVLGMSDRILVMHEGRIAGELSREDATQEAVMHLATGGK